VNPHPLARSVPPAGPLAGVGVIVTRPARQAARFARKLAVLDAAPLIFPAIVILPPADRDALDRAHADLAHYAAVVFVSANAVEYGAPDASRWPPKLAAFVPGPGTAEALADVGIVNVRIPATTYDSEGLLALPQLTHVRGQRIAIFRGDGGREVLGTTLTERGARVDYVECYRRAAPTSGSGLAEALRDGRAHALTLTSSEGADNLWAVLDAEARAALGRLPTFAPHPRIAGRARDLGLNAIETSGGDAGLIAGLLEWFASHPVHTHKAR